MKHSKLTPIKAIRQNCIGCSGNSVKEVRLCILFDCPLFLYRMGRRPTEKEKEELEQAAKDIK
jgi:hypothetical protein